MAFILKETVTSKILYYNTYSERIMALKLKGNKNYILIIEIYAPNDDDSDDE